MTNLQDFRIVDGDIEAASFDVVLVENDEATRQRIEQKFRLFFGEWFLDRNAGVRWFEDVIGQRPTSQILNFILRDVVTSDPGIAKLTSATFANDKVTRQLSITWTALSVTGVTISSEVII